MKLSSLRMDLLIFLLHHICLQCRLYWTTVGCSGRVRTIVSATPSTSLLRSNCIHVHGLNFGSFQDSDVCFEPVNVIRFLFATCYECSVVHSVTKNVPFRFCTAGCVGEHLSDGVNKLLTLLWVVSV